MAKPKFHGADAGLGAAVSLVVLIIFWMPWAEGLEGELYVFRFPVPQVRCGRWF